MRRPPIRKQPRNKLHHGFVDTGIPSGPCPDIGADGKTRRRPGRRGAGHGGRSGMAAHQPVATGDPGSDPDPGHVHCAHGRRRTGQPSDPRADLRHGVPELVRPGRDDPADPLDDPAAPHPAAQLAPGPARHPPGRRRRHGDQGVRVPGTRPPGGRVVRHRLLRDGALVRIRDHAVAAVLEAAATQRYGQGLRVGARIPAGAGAGLLLDPLPAFPRAGATGRPTGGQPERGAAAGAEDAAPAPFPVQHAQLHLRAHAP